MPNDPEDQRRSFFRGRLHVDRIASPDISIKKTFFKLAPSLRIGSIFGNTIRPLTAAAAILVPTAVVAETVGAIDVIDSDRVVVELTILAEEDDLTLFVEPPSVAADGSVFDQILALLQQHRNEEQTRVHTPVVNVQPVSPEVAQTLTQIGSLLEIIQAQGRANAAAIQAVLERLAAIEFPPGPPPGLTQDQATEILDQLDAIEDSQDVIESAIFPGRGSCPECPESVTTDE